MGGGGGGGGGGKREGEGMLVLTSSVFVSFHCFVSLLVFQGSYNFAPNTAPEPLRIYRPNHFPRTSR